MPDRIIRDRSRSSPTLQRLSDGAERAWWRLTTAADDYGRFDADPEVLLAELFKRRPATWTERKMAGCLHEWEEAGLVAKYSIRSRIYIQISSWSTYQRPPRLASKYPDPPNELSIPSERTIHDVLYETLANGKSFCGHSLLLVERNVRAGNGFADLVLTTSTGRIVVELKRTRADRGSINQIVRYIKHSRGVLCGVVLATGMGPTVISHDFESNGIALLVYGNGKTSVAVKNKHIDSCDETLLNVISHTNTFGREARSEKREARSENICGAGAPPRSPSNDFPNQARDVLAWLNGKAKRNFPANPTNLGFILARMREGVSAEQLKAVVSRKVREWSGDEKMAPYLRPATLFNRTKCSQYLGELPAPTKADHADPV